MRIFAALAPSLRGRWFTLFFNGAYSRIRRISVRFDYTVRYVKTDITPECLRGEGYTVYQVIQ